MIKPLRAILKILQGKIILNNGTDVRIVKREYPIDKTPCITIDNSSSTSIIQKNIINKDYIIPNNHPQYTDAERKCHKKDTESGIFHITVESRRINRTVFVIDLEISCEERQIEKTTERDQK